jgi:hypothetical protein
MRERVQKTLTWALVASEASHVFCCVLPTIFSVLSLFVGIGLIASMPGIMVHIHDFIHRWEMPIICVSGLILMAGWGLNYYGRKVDCHDHGCCHGACAPKKSKAHLILITATVLFAFNLSVYLLAHRTTILQNGLASHLVGESGVEEHIHAAPAEIGR